MWRRARLTSPPTERFSMFDETAPTLCLSNPTVKLMEAISAQGHFRVAKHYKAYLVEPLLFLQYYFSIGDQRELLRDTREVEQKSHDEAYAEKPGEAEQPQAQAHLHL